jgi:PAS domain S-box-containing protein
VPTAHTSALASALAAASNPAENSPGIAAPQTAPPLIRARRVVAGLAAAIALTGLASYGFSLSWLYAALAFVTISLVLLAIATINHLRNALHAATEEQNRLTAAVRNLDQEIADFEEAQSLAKYGSWRMDADGNNIVPTSEYMNILGIAEKDFPRDRESWLRQFIAPDNREAVRLSLARGRLGEEVEVTRLYDLGAHGQKWLRMKIIPVFGANGEVESFRGIAHDLTTERIAQTQLAESEERYRLIADNMRDFVGLHTPDGRFIYASPSLARMIGIDAPDAIGKKPFSLVHSDDVAQLREILAEVTNARSETAAVQFRFKHADGHYIWLESIIAPVRGEHDFVTHYQTVTRNVTQRKEAEMALRESEARFRSLIELSSDWYWEQDEHYRFTFVSREAMKMAQTGESGFLGKTRWEAFPGAFSEAEWASHRADLEARRPFVDWVGKVMDESTGTVWGYFSLNGRPVFDAMGNFKGYRGTGHDVTEREIAQRSLASRTHELATTNHRLELEVARRTELEQNFLMAIEMELAQVGMELHDDLGQELTGIALLTKTLERKLKDRGFTETAEAARISDLVNRTIKHTRMISHGLSPYIWGSEGLVSALTQLASDVESLGVVRCTASLDIVEIADEMVARNLYRIAQEAINNALKHSKATHITVSLKQTKAGLKLAVADDGVGGSHLGRLASSQDAEGKLHSIRHRASAIGAELAVRRGPRGGTVISVTMPNNSNPSQKPKTNPPSLSFTPENAQ